MDEAACNQQQETVVRLITENKVFSLIMHFSLEKAENFFLKIFLDVKSIILGIEGTSGDLSAILVNSCATAQAACTHYSQGGNFLPS